MRKHCKGCFCTHCVGLKFTVQVKYGDAFKNAEVSGLSTILDVKRAVSEDLEVPLSQMGKVEEVTRLGNRYLFPDDTRATIADRFGRPRLNDRGLTSVLFAPFVESS